MGLGTDGAATMTGKKEGLTGHFLRANPHLNNTHCSAHRVALCTEQAAKGVNSMQEFQRTLEMIFYHFKKSPTRIDSLEIIQNILEQPVLKYREVHQVRWMSFYEALESVYRTLASLITYLDDAGITDAGVRGIKTRVANEMFISLVYTMLDILKPIMELSVFFQKKDLDIGFVPIKIDECISVLIKIRDNISAAEHCPHDVELKEHLSGGYFKGLVVSRMKQKSHFINARTDFINKVIENIKSRFPNTEFMNALSVLGMRPVCFLNDNELEQWGNESLQMLADFYGQEQTHTYRNKETKEEQVFRSEPFVHHQSVLKEWKCLKMLVKSQLYPTSSLAYLWQIIATHHREDFPNLLKLTMVALTHPIHTADCERAFSVQNRLTTPLRNRLSSEHCDQLMKILIEGDCMKEFDFSACLKYWRQLKMRKIFHSNKDT